MQADCSPGYFGINCRGKCSYPYYGGECQSQCDCDKERCDDSIGCTNVTKGIALWINISEHYLTLYNIFFYHTINKIGY